MGLLGDLFSEIDRKKRQLRGLLSDPAETIYQGIRNFGADQQGLLDTQAQAYPMIATPEQKKRIAGFARTQDQAKKELADAGAAQGMAAATVWHGSPHKFDKFDSSKIGTGEGAQAYGHGLYLAESPDVSKTYMRTQLGNAPELEQMALRAGASPDAANTLAQWYHSTKGRGGIEAALEQLKQPHPAPTIQQFRTKMLEQEPALRKAWGSFSDPGSLYKVDLPDEHIAKMLDWDKPLSQQAPEVRKIIETSDFYKQAKDYQKATGASYNDPSTRTGEGILKYMRAGTTDEMGNAGPWSGGKSAEEYLKSIGIPGIRYLDGGSRGAGTGTSNYVVFPGNEDILKILERNGQGLLGQ